ncbi:MAG: Hsp70 family protein, partial [Cyanobacteria bacterium J06635_10]
PVCFLNSEFKKQTGTDPLNTLAGQQELRSKAEETKKKLSSASSTRVALNVEGQQITFKITQSQFEELIDEIVLRAEMNVELLLEEANLTVNDIDDVLLVGGSTRIPLVSNKLTNFFGKKPLHSLQPDEAVATGAAILANTLAIESGQISTTKSKKVEISDVCAHSLGVVCLNDNGIPENSIIISKNSNIPCEFSQTYGTVSDNQSTVKIEILQGEAKDPEDCIVLGTAYLENLPPSPKGSAVEITFSYDANGILNVTGIFVPTGKTVKAKIEVEGTMSAEEAQQSAKHIQKLDLE